GGQGGKGRREVRGLLLRLRRRPVTWRIGSAHDLRTPPRLAAAGLVVEVPVVKEDALRRGQVVEEGQRGVCDAVVVVIRQDDDRGATDLSPSAVRRRVRRLDEQRA